MRLRICHSERHSAHEFPARADTKDVVAKVDIEIAAHQRDIAHRCFLIGIIIMQELGPNQHIVGDRIFEPPADAPACRMAATPPKSMSRPKTMLPA